MLLLRSSSDSLPTCSIPMSSYRRPCASTSLLTTVSAIVTTSSSSSQVAHSRMSSPSVYLPTQPCARSSSAADTHRRGVYTSSAWMPAWRDMLGRSTWSGSSTGSLRSALAGDQLSHGSRLCRRVAAHCSLACARAQEVRTLDWEAVSVSSARHSCCRSARHVHATLLGDAVPQGEP